MSQSAPAPVSSGQRIIEYAKSFLHVREVGNNGGFNDVAFELLMTTYGWRQGFPWCMFFAKMIWCLCYRDTVHYELVNKTLNGSVMDSYRRAKAAGLRVQDEPVPGGILFFEAGNGKGHAAIACVINDVWKAHTVEGNTNKAGSREGDAVMEKRRILNAKMGKLRYLGCLVPLEIEHGNNTQTIA